MKRISHRGSRPHVSVQTALVLFSLSAVLLVGETLEPIQTAGGTKELSVHEVFAAVQVFIRRLINGVVSVGQNHQYRLFGHNDL